mmetsp:Transcript_28378/g.74533  ORF Transcript_28378/g.74533 Transcript_28378/m.74533 type:complete len:231 (-) Transcript_28378:281-973(-)
MRSRIVTQAVEGAPAKISHGGIRDYLIAVQGLGRNQRHRAMPCLDGGLDQRRRFVFGVRMAGTVNSGPSFQESIPLRCLGVYYGRRGNQLAAKLCNPSLDPRSVHPAVAPSIVGRRVYNEPRAAIAAKRDRLNPNSVGKAEEPRSLHEDEVGTAGIVRFSHQPSPPLTRKDSPDNLQNDIPREGRWWYRDHSSGGREFIGDSRRRRKAVIRCGWSCVGSEVEQPLPGRQA